MYLVSKGIPFDVAFELEDTIRRAWCIVFTENESGKKYNFKTQEFEEVPR